MFDVGSSNCFSFEVRGWSVSFPPCLSSLSLSLSLLPSLLDSSSFFRGRLCKRWGPSGILVKLVHSCAATNDSHTRLWCRTWESQPERRGLSTSSESPLSSLIHWWVMTCSHAHAVVRARACVSDALHGEVCQRKRSKVRLSAKVSETNEFSLFALFFVLFLLCFD